MKSIRILVLILVIPILGFSQSYRIEVEKESIVMDLNGKAQIKALVVDENGKETKIQVNFYSRSRLISIDDEGTITANSSGEANVILISSLEDGKRLRKDVAVTISYPPIKSVEFLNVPQKVFAGTKIKLNLRIIDQANVERPKRIVALSSSDVNTAEVDAYGNLFARETGSTTITAKIEDITNTIKLDVVKSPVAKLRLSSPAKEIRTGDVIHLAANIVDGKGNKVEGVPVYYSFQGEADDVSSSASGLIKQDGRFVVDEPGWYTVTASSGVYSDQVTIRANSRNVKREVKFIGQGTVDDKHTSDFWVWEGVDGKDYAVTGTWGADGTAYFWDVTNPGSMIKIDSIQVDARTVNDVKVSEDGKLCIISREGASTRKNGLVIIDVTNPRDAKILSTFTENLTGGVHNLFISKGHVYALSAGQKYYSINIEDPKNPRIVGEFELDTPGHSIHDVWIEDGIAYSSNWDDGVQLVDIGNGIAGGSPENPKQFASYTYPSGANHAAFPFRSKSADKFYVIAGDEVFPYGLNMDKPNIAGGFLHFVDFSDLENPEEIARFEVPGAGSHNYWVEDDILYVAFYNGGVRMVDISGELMGDLFKQGREIGWYIPADPNGYVPNAPFTWGAQPYKGHVFMSDWNSGLWSVQLAPEKPENVSIEVK